MRKVVNHELRKMRSDSKNITMKKTENTDDVLSFIHLNYFLVTSIAIKEIYG